MGRGGVLRREGFVDLIASFEGVIEDEKALHKKFANQRKRGEWFTLTQDDLNEIHQYFYQKDNP
jgi:hypothetical protein